MHRLIDTSTLLPPIEDVVPHSGAMLLLDRVLEFSPAVASSKFESGRILTELRLRDDSKFVRNGRARGIVMVEYMAQTVAAYAGMQDRTQGAPIEIGYLIGIREMTLGTDYLHSGDHLLVEAVHVFGSSQLGSFKASVKRDGQAIASANLTVYRGKLPEEMA